ncbi:saccharopine dehydrogenase NADP-binding domain-containing protein [Nocardioides lijunqiniae]|uniref:saccharopine dehydrogenase NADP-binding domain-containing protein n=1 Tax=Nocardioides lijunqiniae TaxID=2760832 RepID=UPI0018776220|nr:saccharopine dehydrogenase NADP-binding domain-containing protein [Nocardioides lijunqiniae]
MTTDASLPVLVYGATGHTGRAVVAALVERGLVPVLAGRDADRLASMPGSQGRESRAFAVEAVPDLAGVGLVVNCAGPFADTALPLARAALAAGAHYVDIAAEQPSTLALLHAWAGPAERAGVVVMPGVGFFGALGDLVLTALLGPDDGAPWDHVDVEVELAGWHPTDGTLATGDRNPGDRLHLQDGLLVTTPATTAPGRVELRLSEPLLVSRHLPVRSLQSTVNASAIEDLEAARDLTPDERVRAREGGDPYALRVVARRGAEERTAEVAGDDFYAVTGPLVAEVALALLAGALPPGARAPGELPDPVGLLRRLPLSRMELSTAFGAVP